MRTPEAPSVRLRIERLVLEGVHLDAAGARHFRVALGRELSVLLREDGLTCNLASVAVPHAAAPLAALAGPVTATSLARWVAQGIRDALKGLL